MAFVSTAVAVDLSGQVFARYEMQGEPACGPAGEFLIKRASITAESELGSNLSVELELETRPDEVYLKDCFISWSPLDYLDLTLGQFKKPFCLATDKSNWNMLSIQRPLTHDIVSDLGYSGRSPGFMLEVSVPVFLRTTLSAGVFNGPGTESEKMYAALLSVEPFADIVLGGAVSLLRLGEYDPAQPSGYIASEGMTAFSGYINAEHKVTSSTTLMLDAEYVSGRNWEEADVVYGEIPPGFRSYWVSGAFKRRLRDVPGIRSLEAGLSWSVSTPETDVSRSERVLAPMVGLGITSSARLRFSVVSTSFPGGAQDGFTDYLTELAVRF
ncbi:MAG: hypothetical protein R6V62_09115 [Candidatus Fermentibacteraceae bacterium]